MSGNDTWSQATCLEEYNETVKSGSSWLLLVCPWIFLTVALLGTAANTLAIAAFGKNRRIISRNPRLLVLNQSVIDLCGCVVMSVKWASLYAHRRVPANLLGTLLCHFWFSEYIIWVLVMCSSLNLQVITVERFIALVFPLVQRSPRKLRAACWLVWLYSLMHDWRVFIDVTRGFEPATETCCVYTPGIPGWQSSLFGVHNFCMLYALPLVIMTVCYAAMICSLRRGGRGCGGGGGSPVPEESARRKIAASRVLTKTFMMAGLAYLACFTTNQVCYLLHMFGAIDFDQKGAFYNVSLILVSLNLIVNPVIYFTFMPAFKTAVLRLLRLERGSAELREGTDDTGQNVKITKF